jgi:hypothetical protein
MGMEALFLDQYAEQGAILVESLCRTSSMKQTSVVEDESIIGLPLNRGDGTILDQSGDQVAKLECAAGGWRHAGFVKPDLEAFGTIGPESAQEGFPCCCLPYLVAERTTILFR